MTFSVSRTLSKWFYCLSDFCSFNSISFSRLMARLLKLGLCRVTRSLSIISCAFIVCQKRIIRPIAKTASMELTRDAQPNFAPWLGCLFHLLLQLCLVFKLSRDNSHTFNFTSCALPSHILNTTFYRHWRIRPLCPV